MARFTAVEAPAPFEAIQPTKNENAIAIRAMNTGPGFPPLMKFGKRKPTT